MKAKVQLNLIAKYLFMSDEINNSQELRVYFFIVKKN